ncbi:MAG: hypothetical protein ACQEXX_25245 [Bacillota bacterium]
MNRKLILLIMTIGIIIVTVSPILDSSIIVNYEQLRNHQLGFPFPFVEQHTTLEPFEEHFPFELGFVDPGDHPSRLLFGNYIASIICVNMILLALTWALKWLISQNSSKK